MILIAPVGIVGVVIVAMIPQLISYAGVGFQMPRKTAGRHPLLPPLPPCRYKSSTWNERQTPTHHPVRNEDCEQAAPTLLDTNAHRCSTTKVQPGESFRVVGAILRVVQLHGSEPLTVGHFESPLRLTVENELPVKASSATNVGVVWGEPESLCQFLSMPFEHLSASGRFV